MSVPTEKSPRAEPGERGWQDEVRRLRRTTPFSRTAQGRARRTAGPNFFSVTAKVGAAFRSNLVLRSGAAGVASRRTLQCALERPSRRPLRGPLRTRLVGQATLPWETLFPVTPKPPCVGPPPPPFGWSPSPVSLTLHRGGEASAPFLPCASARGRGTMRSMVVGVLAAGRMRWQLLFPFIRL